MTKEKLDFTKEVVAITPLAAKLLESEVETRKERGFSASKTGIASEAIIKTFGGQNGNS